MVRKTIFTNAEGMNPFSDCYASITNTRVNSRRKFFADLAKSRALAQKALEPRIESYHDKNLGYGFVKVYAQ